MLQLPWRCSGNAVDAKIANSHDEVLSVGMVSQWLLPHSLLDRPTRLPLPQYPMPRLQVSSPEDVARFHEQQLQWLNNTGWKGKARGVVHIPIFAAVRKAVRDGISGRSQRTVDMIKCALLAPLILDVPATAMAQSLPDFSGISYEQRLGAQLPLQPAFRDENGRDVRLGDFTGKPMILALVYFHCPNICGVVRADLFDALHRSGMTAGRDYSLVAISIDPEETSADAEAAKADEVHRYGASGAGAHWHFLSGDAEAVRAISDAVGFRYRFDAQTRQFIHPIGIVLATPTGELSSYLLGVGYQPSDLRLAVARAEKGSPAAARYRSCFVFSLRPHDGAVHAGDHEAATADLDPHNSCHRPRLVPHVQAGRTRCMNFRLPQAGSNAPEIDPLLLTL